MKLRSQSKKSALKYGNLVPKTDKNFFKCNVVVKQSTVCNGVGVFANKIFQRFSYITSYHGELVDPHVSSHMNNRYAVDYDNEKVLIGENRLPLLLGKGVAQLTNDAICVGVTGKSTNCQLVHAGDTIYIQSTRRIEKGEELFCAYGWNYWKGLLSDFDESKQKLIREHFANETRGIYHCKCNAEIRCCNRL